MDEIHPNVDCDMFCGDIVVDGWNPNVGDMFWGRLMKPKRGRHVLGSMDETQTWAICCTAEIKISSLFSYANILPCLNLFSIIPVLHRISKSSRESNPPPNLQIFERIQSSTEWIQYLTESNTRQNPILDRIQSSTESNTWQNPILDRIQSLTESNPRLNPVYMTVSNPRLNPILDRIQSSIPNPSPRENPILDSIQSRRRRNHL